MIVGHADVLKIGESCSPARMQRFQLLNRERDVCRCKRLAVVPFHTLTQRKGNFFAVGRFQPVANAGRGEKSRLQPQ